MGNALIRDWQTAQKQIGQVRQIGQMNQPFVGNLSVAQIHGRAQSHAHAWFRQGRTV